MLFYTFNSYYPKIKMKQIYQRLYVFVGFAAPSEIPFQNSLWIKKRVVRITTSKYLLWITFKWLLSVQVMVFGKVVREETFKSHHLFIVSLKVKLFLLGKK